MAFRRQTKRIKQEAKRREKTGPVELWVDWEDPGSDPSEELVCTFEVQLEPTKVRMNSGLCNN